jgi:DNA mismatch repair ATPase MutS
VSILFSILRLGLPCLQQLKKNLKSCVHTVYYKVMRRRALKKKTITTDDENEIWIESGEARAKREQQLVQYQEVWEHYSKQFDAPVTVLMQCGVFFNWIGLEDPDGREWNNLREVAHLMDLKVGPYNPSKPPSRTNPLRCGVKWQASESKQAMLLDEGYVLVIMMQTDPNDSSKKEVVDVLTRGTRFNEVDNTFSNNMVTLYIENNRPKKEVVRADRLSLSIGMCAIDLSTGSVALHSASSVKDYEAEALDEAYRFTKAMAATEVMVLCRGFEKLDDKQRRLFRSTLEHHLELDSFYLRGIRIDDVRAKQCSNLQRQTEMLENKIYVNSPEALHELDVYPLCRTAFTACVEIIHEGRPHVLQGLMPPEIWDAQTQLVLTHNAMTQLDMMGRGRGKTASLLRLLDHTCTGMGRRLLERWLGSPLLDPTKIRHRLDTVESICALDEDDFRDLRARLENVGVDLMRLLRKAELPNPHNTLTPSGLHKLYQGVQAATKLFQWIGEHIDEIPQLRDWLPSVSVASDVMKFLERIESTFDLELMAGVFTIPTVAKDSHQQRIFRRGVNQNVDEVITRVDAADAKITETALLLGKLLHPTLSRSKYQKKIKIYKGEDNMYYKVTAKLDIVLMKHYVDQARRLSRRSKKKPKRAIRWWNNGADFKKNGGNAYGDSDEDEESNSDEADGGEEQEEDAATRFRRNLQQYERPGSRSRNNNNNNTKHFRKLSDDYVEMLAEMTLSECGHLKLFLPRCDAWYETIKNGTTLIHDTVVAAFNDFVGELVADFQPALEDLIQAVASVDVLTSFAKASMRYNYHKPECVGETDEVVEQPSFFRATELRHPIVEQVLENVEYIPNDLDLGIEDVTCEDGVPTGLMLFGTNNSGKCLGGDVEVLMADGSVKKARDIQSFDVLVGDDGTARIVVSTTRGVGPMFTVKPSGNKGWVEDGYQCNDAHLLVFEASTKCSVPTTTQSERRRVAVQRYEATSKGLKNNTLNCGKSKRPGGKKVYCEDEEDAARLYAINRKTDLSVDFPHLTLSATDTFSANLSTKQKTRNLEDLRGELVQIKESWQGIRRGVNTFPLGFDLQKVVNEALVQSKSIPKKGVPPLTDDMFGYYIGLWLGDGTTRCVYQISQCETLYPETGHFLPTFANSCGLNLIRYLSPSKTTNDKAPVTTHGQIGDIDGKVCYLIEDVDVGVRNKSSRNVIVRVFKHLGMLKGTAKGLKCIPAQLLSTRREVRLAMLAGLLDTDGHYGGDEKHAYEITHKGFDLSNAILRLCRGLGFQASLSRKVVKKSPENDYYRIHITGSKLHEIPCQIRKMMAVKKFGVRKRNEQHYSVQMTYDGEGDYFGFQLAMPSKDVDVHTAVKELKLSVESAVFSGVVVLSNASGSPHTDGRVAGRFLLADHTVTHNTVLLKSAALAVVMAQAGCFVPATTFRFRPFHSVITRLSGKDNMRGGQGTFAVEMSELTTIFFRATPKSLVLGDEICHGTEYPSAVNIVASSIVELLEMKTNFIFATHLHSLSDREDVCSNPRLHFQHFHVETVIHGAETDIIYNRKLRSGSGPATYGIEVAAAQGIPPRVIERAYRMRREMLNEATSIVDTRTSHFNKLVVLDRCAIPECKEKAVHAHHIRFQSEADENGVIDGRFHKNSAFNFAGLCKKHHDEVHHGNLEIKRWAVTLSGKRRLIMVIRDSTEEDEEADEPSPSAETSKKKKKQTSIAQYWGRKKK